METKIKIEKMPTVLEDIVQDKNWIPAGQKKLKQEMIMETVFLQAGYKLITEREICKELNTYGSDKSGDTGLQYENLDDYTKTEIPEEVIKKVRKARNLGIKNFLVYYPYFEGNDPIITAQLCLLNKEFFITKW